MDIQADGKIVLAGRAQTAATGGTYYYTVLARYTFDGALDTTFGASSAPVAPGNTATSAAPLANATPAAAALSAPTAAPTLVSNATAQTVGTTAPTTGRDTKGLQLAKRDDLAVDAALQDSTQTCWPTSWPRFSLRSQADALFLTGTRRRVPGPAARHRWRHPRDSTLAPQCPSWDTQQQGGPRRDARAGRSGARQGPCGRLGPSPAGSRPGGSPGHISGDRVAERLPERRGQSWAGLPQFLGQTAVAGHVSGKGDRPEPRPPTLAGPCAHRSHPPEHLRSEAADQCAPSF